MYQTFDGLSGSPGHTFETKKLPDGTFQVTSPSMEGKVWVAETEIDAIREATKEAYEMACRGELGNNA